MKARKAIFLFLALCALAVPALRREEPDLEPGSPDTSSLEEARSSTSYVLLRGGWLRFRIPAGQTLLKMVTNANVPGALYGSKDFSASYSLHFQLVDDDGNIVREQTYIQSSGFLIYLDELTGSILPAHFYRSLPIVPLGSRALHVNLEGFADRAKELRVRLGSADTAVSDLAVRVYYNDIPPPYKLRYLWQRMAGKKKERLARANIYTVDLLTEEEKRNLLENRWAALAPLGIAGRDYDERKLYSVRRDETVRQVQSILPRGLYVDHRLLGVVPIPENGGCIRLDLELIDLELRDLELRDIDEEKGSPGSSRVHVTWFGEDPGERNDTAIELTGAITTYHREYRGGYLEIQSEEALAVRAALLSSPLEIDITPEPGAIPSYTLRKGEKLDFEVNSYQLGSTSVRLDLRRRWTPGGFLDPPEARIQYQLLDLAGNVLGGGYLLHDEPLSHHDTALEASGEKHLSEPSRRYFWLRSGCTSLRLLTSDEDIIATVYTRPDALPRQVRVPEDYLAFEKGDDGLRNWFLVRPTNYAECLRKQGETLIKVQERPPVYSDELSSGDFQAVLLEPLGGVQGYKVLTPARDAGERKFSPARFLALSEEEPERLFVGGHPGEEIVTPRLICLKATEDPATLKVFVDGTLFVEDAFASRSVELELPAIPVGWRRVSVKTSEPAETYMNCIDEPSGSVHVERIVYSVGRAGLLYRVDKETEGKLTLIARSFLPSSTPARVRLRAELNECRRYEGIPVDSWTFQGSHFDIRPPDQKRWPVISTDEASLGGGESFFLSLGSDLKPGTYEIALFLEEGAGCYLQLVKLAPGRRDHRKFFLERGPLPRESVNG